MNRDLVFTRYPKIPTISKKTKSPFVSNWSTLFFLGFVAILIILFCTFVFFISQIKQKRLKNESSDIKSTEIIRLELNNRAVDVQVPIRNWGSSKYTAVIIEPRKHKALEFVLQNYAENLDEDWKFILIYSTDNESYVADIMRSEKMQQYITRFSLIRLGITNMKLSDYNCIFYNESFYDLIPTETFLIFQTDSMILRENREKINDFFKYDYVGAPWPYTMGNLGYMKVGNGGLSLRKKSKMLELLKYKRYAVNTETEQIYGKHIAEDQFFCGFLVKEVKLYKPYWEKAKEFSVEFVFYDAPFGLHACWKGLSQKEMDLLIKLYPDIKELYKLNKAMQV
jgi:hypothetical protein